MLDQQYRDAFDRDGFVVVRQFLAGPDFRDLTSQLDRYIREVVPSLPPDDAFYHDRSRPQTLKQMQHMGKDPFFSEYPRRGRWAEMAGLLLGEDVTPHEPEWFNKPPGTEHPTPPHQDNYYFCLKPPNVVTLWLALDSADERNGCIRYVPGSHRCGIRPHNPTKVLGFSQGIIDYGPADEQREIPMQLEPGDLIAHHGETIHRAEPNGSERHRRAFAIVYRGQSCQRDEQAYARYLGAMKQQHQGIGTEVA